MLTENSRASELTSRSVFTDPAGHKIMYYACSMRGIIIPQPGQAN